MALPLLGRDPEDSMLRYGVLTLLILCGTIQPALAQQTVNFTVGFFTLPDAGSRNDDDVLTALRAVSR